VAGGPRGALQPPGRPARAGRRLPRLRAGAGRRRRALAHPHAQARAGPGPDGTTQAPHIDVSIFARGLLNRVVTRIYFADEEELNAEDPLLATLDHDAQRATLLAQPADDGYRIDFRLQGEGETVCFAI
jgi:protocatechuate 3,4-dioxygenase alpha subunit